MGDGVVLWAGENVELCEKAQPTRRATPMLTLGDGGEFYANESKVVILGHN